MSSKYNVLILGASYGSLLASKLLVAGHSVTMVCTPSTASLINDKGTLVKLPVRGRDELVEIESKQVESASPGATIKAAAPDDVQPGDFDLVVLGMQEPQYSSQGVRELLQRVAAAKVPSMAIMNMPPLPYLRRLKGLDIEPLMECYAEPELWKNFDPDLVTLASPDPQAFRPEDAGKNVLQVSLPTNFKVAAFPDPAHTAMLRQMQDDIANIEWDLPEGGSTALPVKLNVFDSLFVPLAKWSMLVTGNYRCVLENDMRSIKDAVHSDLDESREIYQWVVSLCETMGADASDMVPFDKYANAASGLVKPSSGARALFGGAPNIERVDSLVRNIAAQHGMQLDSLNQTVAHVDRHLAANRLQKKAS